MVARKSNYSSLLVQAPMRAHFPSQSDFMFSAGQQQLSWLLINNPHDRVTPGPLAKIFVPPVSQRVREQKISSPDGLTGAGVAKPRWQPCEALNFIACYVSGARVKVAGSAEFVKCLCNGHLLRL